jgi:hypothetical protein
MFSLHTVYSSIGPLETFDFTFLNMCLLINDWLIEYFLKSKQYFSYIQDVKRFNNIYTTI